MTGTNNISTDEEKLIAGDSAVVMNYILQLGMPVRDWQYDRHESAMLTLISQIAPRASGENVSSKDQNSDKPIYRCYKHVDNLEKPSQNNIAASKNTMTVCHNW